MRISVRAIPKQSGLHIVTELICEDSQKELPAFKRDLEAVIDEALADHSGLRVEISDPKGVKEICVIDFPHEGLKQSMEALLAQGETDEPYNE